MACAHHSPAHGQETIDYHTIRRDPLAGTAGRIEGESSFLQHGHARIQAMNHFGPDWSGGAHFLWDGKIGDAARVQFRILHESTYSIKAKFTKAPDYGRFQLKLDEQPLGDPVDLYSTRVELAESTELGIHELSPGIHTLEFQLIGANKKARTFRGDGYLLGLDYLEVIDQSPRKPEPKERIEIIPPSLAKRLIGQHCMECHGRDTNQIEGDIDLRALLSTNITNADHELIEKVADAISFGTMPPDTAPQINPTDRAKMSHYFENLLDQSAGDSASIAPALMRRMTRYEYNNAVRDLLNLRGDIYPLPERSLRRSGDYFRPSRCEFPSAVQVGTRTLGKNQVEREILDGVSPFAIDLQAEHGFNNQGEQLSISPLLLQTFVELGESIVNSPQLKNYCFDYSALFEGSPSGNENDDIELMQQRLPSLLFRAFRRPVDQATLERYEAFFRSSRQSTDSYETSMKKLVAAVLASPRFLFIRQTGTSSTKRLSDFELAERLSFFLWSSIPDQELLRLAEAKRLSDPVTLDLQVERMILNKKCIALSESFARQWLRLDQLITAVPDFERFPAYYSRIGCEQWKFGLQTMVEPLLLFESVMVEDRSIMLFVDCNYAYRSDELESWYSDDVPFGGRGNANRFNTGQQQFTRRLLKDRRQGGVITTAATMTMTSSPLRTSPITRGAWVATVIFNRPPDPPPDVVPEIEADDREIEAQGLTLRQRLKQHQVNQSCAACHVKIDPLGFALENYDAVGRWRDEYQSGLAIDASGKLFGDEEFTDITTFKDIVLRHPKVFMRAFSEHMLSYALGRQIEVSDHQTIDHILRRVELDHGRFSTVVKEVVKSYPFRYKPSQSSSEPMP